SPGGSKRNRKPKVEICPPALPRPRRGWRRRLLDWLAGSWPDDIEAATEAAPPATGEDPAIALLETVRLEFTDAIGDIPITDTMDLRQRIRGARSLRELWHLRTEVFNI